MPIVEGSGQKLKSRRRSGVQIAGPKGPTVRSRVVARVTPKKNTATALAGIGGLGQALSGFFKQIGPITEAVSEIAQKDELAEIQMSNAVELAKIKEENKNLALTGTAKALKGEKLTDEEKGRRAAVEAYENTIGAKIGWDLVAKWKLHMETLSEGVGTQEAWETFIKKELRNSTERAGIGTGNPRVDVAIMAVLHRGTAEGRRGRQLQRAKQEMNVQSLRVADNMKEELDNGMPNYDFSFWVDKLKNADPRNSATAEASVTAWLLAWAGTNKEKGVLAIAVLEREGVDKRIGPVAWNKLVDGLINQQNRQRNFAGRDAFTLFNEKFIPQLKSIPFTNVQEFARVYQVVQLELKRIANTHGQQSGMYAKSLSAMNKITTKFATAAAAIQKIRMSIANVFIGVKSGRLDYVNGKKYFSEVARLLNPLGINNPGAEALMLHRSGAASTINAQYKGQYTSALTNMGKNFGNTMRTLMAFAALSKGNEDAVMQLIGPEVHTIYKAAVSDFKLGKTWDEIATRITTERREGAQFDHTFKQMVLSSGASGVLGVTGNEGEAQTKVMELLNDAFKDQVKGLGNVADQTLRIVSKMALREWAILKQGDKDMTAKRAVGLFVEAMISGGSLTMVPGASDSVQLTFTRQPRHGQQIGPAQPDITGTQPHVTVGFGVRTSRGGWTEDITQNYRRDRDDIAKFAFQGLLTKIGGAITSDSLGLDANHPVAGPRGLFIIKSNGQNITFHPGQTITIGGKEVTLPKNVTDAVIFLNKLDAFEGGTKAGVEKLNAKERARAAEGLGTLTVEQKKITHRQKTMNQRIVYLVVGDAIVLTYRPGFIEDPEKRPLSGFELATKAEKARAKSKADAKLAREFTFDKF